MKIAVIGSGISGLSAAYYLSRHHDVYVFEKNSRIGGHTATHDFTYDGQDYSIDTGFIFNNDRTYPNFIALLEELGVTTQESSMSFSVSSPSNKFEFAGNSLDSLFAQRKNIVSPSFYRMLFDICWFNRRALSDIEAGYVDNEMTLGEYIEKLNLEKPFRAIILFQWGCYLVCFV